MLVLALTALSACKVTHRGEAAGEVSEWTPPKPDEIDGVPVDAVKSAIQQRLTGAMPKGVPSDTWRHVRSLYANYAGAPLWLDKEGLSADRVSELANALASADSDAIRVDSYPIGDLAKAVSTLRTNKTPTADELADADVLMTSTFAALGEDLLTGQIDPRTVSQSWYINPREEHIDTALARTLREGPLDRSIQLIRPQDPTYDSLRVQLMHYRELAAKGDWPTVPKGPQLKPRETDSRARLTALAARLRAEGYLPADSTVSSDSTDGRSGRMKYDTQRRRGRRLPGSSRHRRRQHARSGDGRRVESASELPTWRDRSQSRAISLVAAHARRQIHPRERPGLRAPCVR
jgi:murein L,D-transpeptidase YcbB/YkuD